jgi:uncharacterized protein
MKPGDHPDFYRIAPPPGTSRESTIRLDAEGKFWHDGERVDHPSLEKALHGWIARHPDDGRFILTNGYDWTYFRVDDVPYTVRALSLSPEAVTLTLSDDSEEALLPETLRVGRGDALYAKVKRGQFEARFSRHAQTALAPILEEAKDGSLRLRVGGREYAVPSG